MWMEVPYKLMRGGRSLVSRQPHKLKVAGSNPAPATKFCTIAQLVEQQIVNLKVAGSSPASTAINVMFLAIKTGQTSLPM